MVLTDRSALSTSSGAPTVARPSSRLALRLFAPYIPGRARGRTPSIFPVLPDRDYRPKPTATVASAGQPGHQGTETITSSTGNPRNDSPTASGTWLLRTPQCPRRHGNWRALALAAPWGPGHDIDFPAGGSFTPQRVPAGRDRSPAWSSCPAQPAQGRPPALARIFPVRRTSPGHVRKMSWTLPIVRSFQPRDQRQQLAGPRRHTSAEGPAATHAPARPRARLGTATGGRNGRTARPGGPVSRARHGPLAGPAGAQRTCRRGSSDARLRPWRWGGRTPTAAQTPAPARGLGRGHGRHGATAVRRRDGERVR